MKPRTVLLIVEVETAATTSDLTHRLGVTVGDARGRWESVRVVQVQANVILPTKQPLPDKDTP